DLVTANLPESFAAHTISIVGLSYILFRQIQFLVDANQGQIDATSLWSYANYQLSVFTILSGPIQRYQDYHRQWGKLDPVLMDAHAIRRAYFRLLLGMVKLAVLATAFLWLYHGAAQALVPAAGGAAELSRGAAVRHFLGVLYFYPLYLYLNF